MIFHSDLPCRRAPKPGDPLSNDLTLKAERKREHEEDRKNYRRVESFYGTFSRSFALPETADLDKVTADYKNGILTISIPLKPELKPREIPVKAA